MLLYGGVLSFLGVGERVRFLVDSFSALPTQPCPLLAADPLGLPVEALAAALMVSRHFPDQVLAQGNW